LPARAQQLAGSERFLHRQPAAGKQAGKDQPGGAGQGALSKTGSIGLALAGEVRTYKAHGSYFGLSLTISLLRQLKVTEPKSRLVYREAADRQPPGIRGVLDVKDYSAVRPFLRNFQSRPFGDGGLVAINFFRD
jgi:hypothetical protein